MLALVRAAEDHVHSTCEGEKKGEKIKEAVLQCREKVQASA